MAVGSEKYKSTIGSTQVLINDRVLANNIYQLLQNQLVRQGNIKKINSTRARKTESAHGKYYTSKKEKSWSNANSDTRTRSIICRQTI